MTDIIKSLPASETKAPGITCETASGKEYRITQDAVKKRFTLWAKTEKGYEKIRSADSPSDLDKLIPWDS